MHDDPLWQVEQHQAQAMPLKAAIAAEVSSSRKTVPPRNGAGACRRPLGRGSWHRYQATHKSELAQQQVQQ